MTENRPRGGLWFTTKELAEAFFVTPRTIRRWVHAKLLEPRYRLRGGTCYELVFLNSEVARFMDEYLPTRNDLDHTTWSKTRSAKERADRLRHLMNMNRLYAGRLNAMQPAKESGLEGKEIEETEPVIVEQKPRRQRNRQEGKGEAEDEWSPRESRGEEET